MADDPKLAEFRERNVVLMKENEDKTKQLADLTARYDGIDPEEYRNLKTKATAGDTELQALKSTLATRDGELTAEKTAHADTRKRADSAVIESKISDAALKAGCLPKARAFIVSQGAGVFTVAANGQLTSTKFSPDRPGEPMSLDEWVTLQTRENSFAFAPSSGGGSNPSKGHPGTSGKVLKNPSPQDLGKFSKEIASGELRVVYE
jgi:hypothetical protein